jgi:hypothetical protein
MLLQAEKNARVLRRDLIPQVSGVIVRDLQRTLGRTRTLVTGLASEFAQDRTTFEQANDAALYNIPDSLADSIVSASEAHDAVSLPKTLAFALARNAGIDDEEWDMLIDLDDLSDDLDKVTRQYPLPATDRESPDSRLQVITEYLRSEARNVFAREAAATPQVSTLIRLSALLLAGEMNNMTKARTWQYSGAARPQSRSRTAVLYRDVVAGITWLERRTNGTDTATEMIMLAIE